MDIEPGVLVHRYLGEEIALVLVNAAEPGGVGDRLDPGKSKEPVPIGEWQGEDQGDRVDHVEPVGAGGAGAALKTHPESRQKTEQEERHQERADGQRRPDLLAAQIGPDQPEGLHAPALTASIRTPLSR